MSRDEVLILTGPPGSGKTTVARLLTARCERAVHLESDLFWHFITSGYIEPWKPGSHEQNTMVMQIVAEVAARYAATASALGAGPATRRRLFAGASRTASTSPPITSDVDPSTR